MIEILGLFEIFLGVLRILAPAIEDCQAQEPGRRLWVAFDCFHVGLCRFVQRFVQILRPLIGAAEVYIRVRLVRGET